MANTKQGRILQFCVQKNISENYYNLQIGKGFKWCGGCKEWHKTNHFGVDSSRYDGLASTCFNHRKKLYKRIYIPKPRQSKKGLRFVLARAGDKKQARHRVNHLISIGLLQNPNNLPCVDCKHTKNDEKKRRHEYDHYLGYEVENQETVEVVCTICHKKRTKKLSHGDK